MNANAIAWFVTLILFAGLLVVGGPAFMKLVSRHLAWIVGGVLLTALAVTFVLRRLLELALRVPGVATTVALDRGRR